MRPKPTLYIRNLREIRNIKAVKTALTAIFSKYGEILDIKVKRNVKHRGQAFVAFADVDSATRAKAEVHGFPLFSMPMDIQYAREQSFANSEVDGTIEEHKQRREELKAQRMASKAEDSGRKKRKVAVEEALPPNNILFVQSLPEDVTEEAITALFRPFMGFKEVRLVPNRSDIAFVEYENEIAASIAKQALHCFRMGQDKDEIRVTFAKK
nr:hypothetical protein HK105_006376 [Polyrhizophydium stewartii]